jgi:hypothetical protein
MIIAIATLLNVAGLIRIRKNCASSLYKQLRAKTKSFLGTFMTMYLTHHIARVREYITLRVKARCLMANISGGELQETQRMTTVVEGIVAESRVVLQRIDIDDKVSTPLASVKYHI